MLVDLWGGGDAGWRLERWGRYSHTASHVEALASQHGLTITKREEIVLRHEQSKGVNAIVYVLRCDHS